MATKKKAPVFDITTVQRAPRYVWREVEREDAPPLRVKVKDLGIAETEAIPVNMRTALSESLQAIAPYVVEWDFEAVNKETGETIPVPPPAEAGWEVLEILSEVEAGTILAWLKYPTNMKIMQEKKASEGK